MYTTTQLSLPSVHAFWRQTQTQPAQKSCSLMSAAWLLPASGASCFRLWAMLCSAIQHLVCPYPEYLLQETVWTPLKYPRTKPYLCQQAMGLPSPYAVLYVQPGICPPGPFGCSLLTEIPSKSAVKEGMTINIPEQTITQDSKMCFGSKSLCRIP